MREVFRAEAGVVIVAQDQPVGGFPLRFGLRDHAGAVRDAQRGEDERCPVHMAVLPLPPAFPNHSTDPAPAASRRPQNKKKGATRRWPLEEVGRECLERQD